MRALGVCQMLHVALDRDGDRHLGTAAAAGMCVPALARRFAAPPLLLLLTTSRRAGVRCACGTLSASPTPLWPCGTCWTGRTTAWIACWAEQAEETFHPECFCCEYCDDTIVGGNYSKVQGKRCCPDCKPYFCARKECRQFCEAGDRVYLQGAMALDTGSGSGSKQVPYHAACLQCKTCNAVQTEHTAACFNGGVFCKRCVSLIYCPH
jgi:hypothetical protein